MARIDGAWTFWGAVAFVVVALGAVHADMFRVGAVTWGVLVLVWFVRVIFLTSRFASSRAWLAAARSRRERDGWIVAQFFGLLMLPVLLLAVARRPAARVARATAGVAERIESGRIRVQNHSVRVDERTGRRHVRWIGAEWLDVSDRGRFLGLEGWGFDVVILRDELFAWKRGESYFAYRLARFENAAMPLRIRVDAPSSWWPSKPADVPETRGYWVEGDAWPDLWIEEGRRRDARTCPPEEWRTAYDRLLHVTFRTWP